MQVFTQMRIIKSYIQLKVPCTVKSDENIMETKVILSLCKVILFHIHIQINFRTKIGVGFIAIANLTWFIRASGTNCSVTV